MTCPVCGTVPVPGAHFCHNCGAALPAAATLPAAERRVVTVLFGDLSDFTAWSEGVDPERVGAVTDRVLAALAGAVKTFGGHVDKLTGDGIMAVFGAPVAHEDDAERAVRAGLAMQRAVRRVLDDERGGGAPVGLRIGVNTGVVVAGVQASLEYTVIGDTVNTAARLADAAAIGTVYAGAGTHAATRNVASWRRLAPLRLKGKRDPVEAYELLGLNDAQGMRSGLGDEAPFVGRETELGLVANRLAEAMDRAEPRVLVVTAEAGVGKTRFAAQAARLAAGFDRGGGGGARVLSVRCAAYGERRRLAPLADLVRVSVGLPAEPSAAATREAATDRLRRLVHAVERSTGSAPRLHTEALLGLLGYVEAGEKAMNERTERAESDLEAVPAAVAELLSALATEAPLLVIVDDLHDATPQTVNALGAMLSRLEGPALVVLLGRPELVRTAGVLTRLSEAEVSPLPPLRGAEAARLLASYLDDGRLAPTDEDRLLATAQGNPFYLAELVTLLMERGSLTLAPPAPGERVAAAHRVAAERAAAERGVVSERPAAPRLWRLAPGSFGGRLLSRDLAAVLAARIDALPADARAVLRDASVVGDEVPAGALEALRDRRAHRSGRPAAVAAVELERAVDELLHRRMLLPLTTPGAGYAFATPLMREAAYAGVGKADLAERHAQLVLWSGRLSPTSVGWSADTLDAFIADQAERACGLADAVSLRSDAMPRAAAPIGAAALERLARRALTSGEPEQAMRFAERAGAFGPAPVPLRLIHASAMLQLGRTADALAEAEKVGADSPDDPANRARALILAGRAYRALNEHGRSAATLDEALEVAVAAGLTDERAEALRRIGMEEFVRGHLTHAAERFNEALAIADSAGDKRGQAWALQNIAWVSTTRGDFDGADETLARAARLFAELQDGNGRAWLRGTTAFARLLAGRLHEARRLAGIFLPFGERIGERWAVGTLRAVEAFAAAELGDLASADRQARQSYREFTDIDDSWGRGLALVVRGAVARGLAEPEHADDLLSDAVTETESAGHPLLIALARTMRGFVRLDQGDPARATADARAVLAGVEAYGIGDPARVGPRVLLGSALLAEGDAQAALAVLGELAAAERAPSVLFPRRHAVAAYAGALLAAGREADALAAARRAVCVPAEDVRSRVVAEVTLAQVLAAVGEVDEARSVARNAVREGYATQQASERAHADAILAAVD
jgi:class 3 adenylate cyclase/tetratricopeptide (TPR) repeat protein